MLQAMAALYAYSVVFYGHGLRPVHLMGLDRYRVFHDHFTDDALRDAYYLWCFDQDWSKKCFYLPNFYHGSVAVRGFVTEIPYYTQEEFEKWQGNSKEYVQETKQFLVHQSGTLGHDRILTLDMLNDKDLLDWATFSNSYWQSDPYAVTYNQDLSLFYHFSYYSFHGISGDTVLFPSRRCESEDYSELYRDRYSNKPRTIHYPLSLNSSFPIQTRTRVEALARSNCAYLIAIVVAQCVNIMACKTRLRSLFEQGMKNTMMNYALIFTIILCAVLVYIPLANTVTGTRPIRFIWWTSAIPFALVICVYDELRKGWIRRKIFGWIHRNTYW
eukprot:875949_1